MSVYTYPGIYIEEIPSGVRPITGVSTATTAFIGFFGRGHVDRAVRCNNYGDFERDFGGLDARSEASYGIQQYFLNGGSVAYVIRVTAPYSYTDDDGNAAVAIPIESALELPAQAGGNAFIATASNVGTWGDAIHIGVVNSTDGQSFSLSIREYQGDRIVRGEVYENVNATIGSARNVRTVVNAASTLVRISSLQPGSRPVSSATLAANLVAMAQANHDAATIARDVATAAAAVALTDIGARQTAVDKAMDDYLTTNPAVTPEQIALAAANNALTAAGDAVIAATIDHINAPPAIPAAITAADEAQTAFDDARIAWADDVTAAGSDPVPYLTQVTDAVDAATGPGTDPILADDEARFAQRAGATFVQDNDPAAPGGGSVDHIALTAAADALVAAIDDLFALRAPRRTGAAQSPVVLAALAAVEAARADVAVSRAAAVAAAIQTAPVQAAQTNLDDATSASDQAARDAAAAVAAVSSAQSAVDGAKRGAVVRDLDDVSARTSHRLTGGNDGAVPGSTEWRANASVAINGSESNGTGLYALDNIAPEIFNLMCIPDAPGLAPAAASDPDGISAVYAEADAYCLRRRAFLIVDPPPDAAGVAKSVSINAVAAWPGVRSPNAAIYYPRLLLSDPLADGAPRSRSASGTVAGIYARTDAARGVWKAPAGTDTTLRGPGLRVEHVLTDKENGQLSSIGINALRNFKLYNNIAWGARTTVGADATPSEWKYVSVRRTALFIEESLSQGLKWVVFESNDEPLWASIRLNVTAYMHGLFRRGAFQGSTPKDAYLVRCDSETTTQADINTGVVNIVIGFAPLKPAEFVVIKLTQLVGQSQA